MVQAWNLINYTISCSAKKTQQRSNTTITLFLSHSAELRLDVWLRLSKISVYKAKSERMNILALTSAPALALALALALARKSEIAFGLTRKKIGRQTDFLDFFRIFRDFFLVF